MKQKNTFLKDLSHSILNYINHKGCVSSMQLQKVFGEKETIDENVIAGLTILINQNNIGYMFTNKCNYYYSKDVRH